MAEISEIDANKDYYAVLEIGPSVLLEDIKKAYRSLAMKLHPDKNPGNNEAAENFRAVQQAYEILSDDKTKAHYDDLRILAHRSHRTAESANEYVDNQVTAFIAKKMGYVNDLRNSYLKNLNTYAFEIRESELQKPKEDYMSAEQTLGDLKAERQQNVKTGFAYFVSIILILPAYFAYKKIKQLDAQIPKLEAEYNKKKSGYENLDKKFSIEKIISDETNKIGKKPEEFMAYINNPEKHSFIDQETQQQIQDIKNSIGRVERQAGHTKKYNIRTYNNSPDNAQYLKDLSDFEDFQKEFTKKETSAASNYQPPHPS